MTNSERFPGNWIHETAIIYEGAVIGTGNKIGPYCIIGAPPEYKGNDDISGNVRIGDNNTITGLVTIDSGTYSGITFIDNNCYIMKGAHIGHDSFIYDDVTISCGAKIGGHSIIYKGCVIGLNAVIHQHKKVPPGCMIGMGAVVTKNLYMDEFKIYAGNPAKYIGKNVRHPQYNINEKESL